MNEDFVVAAAGAVLLDREHGETEKIYLKRLRDESNPFHRSHRKFTKLFRVSPQMAQHIIEVLCAGNELHTGTIPAHLKVFSALNFFAHGSYQTAVGEINIIAQSQPSISRGLTAVCSVIIERLTPHWIKFPTTTEERERTMQGFQEMFGMPHTLGAVDGSHIGIHKPPLNHPTAPGSLFYNRKGFYSINCQMVCDANGWITSVNPNFPGSTHDAAIWRSSNVNEFLEDRFIREQPTEWLLGDKGYPLLPWLMIPTPDPLPGSREERYNKCHSQARGIIEMTFGMLKSKMRCLHRHRILHYKPEKAANIILACATIHNMLRRESASEMEESSGSESTDSDNSDSDTDTDSDTDDSDEDDNDEPPVVPAEDDYFHDDFLNAGWERRENLINRYFST